MIRAIVGYGHPVLRKVAQPIDKSYPELETLINDMFETMYNAYGVGLAAPQIDLPIRLVVIDADPMKEVYSEGEGFKRYFINPVIIEESGEPWAYQEGCLSLPDLHEDVMRKPIIKVRYQDLDFNEYEEEFSGIRARVLQHELDHLEGKVFTDRLSPLRRTLLKRKLNDLASGKVRASYRMKFAK